MSKLHIGVGSRSDLKLVKESKMTVPLEAVDISYSVHVCSAHRNAAELAEFVAGCNEEDVFIGIAGMAAALPGALAGASKMMSLVIAVPLDEDGIDSCLYMPPGVPVATAGVGKAGLMNAALLACQVMTRGGLDSQPAALKLYLATTAKQAEFDLDKTEVRPDA